MGKKIIHAKWAKLHSVLFILIAPLFFTAGYLYSGCYKQTNSFESAKMATQSIQEDDVPVPSNKVFPPSNIEWFNMYSKLSQGGLDTFKVTWRVSGQVTEVSQDNGKLGGYEYYSTGPDKGYFEYLGRIRLKENNNTIVDWHFSRRRMELVKVYSYRNGSLQEVAFSEIKAGNNIEIEETVDLIIPNTDDNNVQEVIIRIKN